MKGWSVAALIFLSLTGITILLVILYIIGNVFRLNYADSLGYWGFQITVPVIDILVNLFIAATLYRVKEGIWRALAFVALALLSAVQLVAFQFMHLNNIRAWNIIGYFSTLTYIYLFIQSFLIKNRWLVTSLRLFSLFIVLQNFVDLAIPFVIAKLAMPNYDMLRYLSFISLFILSAKVYLLIVIYNYFNRQDHQDQFDFKQQL